VVSRLARTQLLVVLGQTKLTQEPDFFFPVGKPCAVCPQSPTYRCVLKIEIKVLQLTACRLLSLVARRLTYVTFPVHTKVIL